MAYNPETARRYYERHREEILAKMHAAYQEKNRDRIADRAAKREARLLLEAQRTKRGSKPSLTNAETKRRYRERHPERVREMTRQYSRQWRERHPGKNAELQAIYRQCGIRWRAAERAVWVEAIVPLAVYELADGICWMCGEDVPPDRYDIDHVIPLAAGGEHSYENVRLACMKCNRGHKRRA
jgi:5-methylcytosine-specific restriction endonuclease McrA